MLSASGLAHLLVPLLGGVDFGVLRTGFVSSDLRKVCVSDTLPWQGDMLSPVHPLAK